ncbi:uncharacterized protein LOC123503836 isoform X2 [Portunus trituberculatus]|uniref:uncharacterized protein LOC123503836 isoform X2 n=2 Tax=Portunus trituberculatus TaxID=210409 RepID=UPI001E1CB118|nr:uncharacterized protein LOC123503836 isoform X2 [Portunus trituberculatus]
MENRPRRTGKSAFKGSSGPSRRNCGRGRDVMSPMCASATQAESGEATGTATSKNALRERTRVESLRKAYMELQAAIPSVPPNTKLSKLDVLVLATTYISHLSQLLQEDDLRATHDTNNNTTAAAVGVKAAGVEQHTHYPKVASTARGSQKGLLHPVKKWPMRARLYPGVAVSEAAMLLGEQPSGFRHLRSRLNPSPATSSPYPLAAHVGSPTLQQPHTAENGSCNSTGMLSENGVTADVNDAATFLNGALPGTHTCLPPPYAAHYLGTWESEGGWGPDVTCSDMTTCPQPLATYTGCWSSWQD